MWHLISTGHRNDGSTTSMYVLEQRRGRWLRDRRRVIARWRRERLERRQVEVEGVGDRVIDAVGPVAERHGLAPTGLQPGDSVIWCTDARDVRLVDGELSHDGEPTCIDLWVHIDQALHTIAVGLEWYGLHEFLTGTTHWDHVVGVPLDDDLDRSLEIVASHIDRWFDAIIVTS